MAKERNVIKKICAGSVFGICVIDSFLLDPFLLMAVGIFIVWLNVRHLMKSGKSYIWALSLLTLILFWSISISLYFNLPWVHWIAELCHAQNGRDWMINSGVFHFDIENLPDFAHVLSGFLFATYPLWLWLGIQLGHILFGRKSRHKGLLKLLSLK